MEHDSPKLLFRLACEYLSSSRLVRPGVVLVLERVAAARKRARKETWQRLEPALTGFLRAGLDGMLVPTRCWAVPGWPGWGPGRCHRRRRRGRASWRSWRTCA